MEKSSIVGLIIGGLFIFVLGGGLGVSYKTQQSASQLEKLQKSDDIINKFASSEILSAVADGKVTKIEGKNITLFSGNQTLTIPVASSATVNYFINDDAGGITPKQGNPTNIKIGDSIEIKIKVSSGGVLEGQLITIVPSIKK